MLRLFSLWLNCIVQWYLFGFIVGAVSSYWPGWFVEKVRLACCIWSGDEEDTSRASITLNMFSHPVPWRLSPQIEPHWSVRFAPCGESTIMRSWSLSVLRLFRKSVLNSCALWFGFHYCVLLICFQISIFSFSRFLFDRWMYNIYFEFFIYLLKSCSFCFLWRRKILDN